MHKKYRYRRRLLSFLAASLLVPALVMSVPMPDVRAGLSEFNQLWQTIFSGDRDEIEAADSFYDLASVVGNTFSAAAGETAANEVIFDDFEGFDISYAATRAGGLLGYCDEQHAKNGFNLGSLSSYSSAEWSYGMLFDNNAEWNKNGMVFAPYVSLGAVFSDLGVDKTGSDFESGFVRKAVGILLMFAYSFSMVVPFVFQLVVKFLKLLNPFQFFWEAGGNLETQYAALKGPGSDKFPGVSEFVRQWFTILQNAGGFVITFFLVVLIFTILLSRRARYDVSPYKKWMIRAAFIVFGIPLLGSTYSAMLDWIDEELVSGNMSGSKVIASTLCDFESFVNNGMRYSDNLYITVNKDGSVYASDRMNAQDVCLEINSNSGYFGDAFALYSGTTGTGSTYDNTGAVNQMIEGLQNVAGDEAANVASAIHVYDMLNRYMSGSKISSSDYAGRQAAKIWLSSSGNEKKAVAVQWFLMHYNSVSALEGESVSILRADGRPKDLDYGGVINPFKLSSRNYSSATSGYSGGVPSGWAPSEGKIERTLNYVNWDPSIMSVYNYLRSDFSNNKLTVYSAKNSSSDAVQKNHYSVNLVGKGIQPLMIVITSVSMLISFGVIGIYYSLGIVMTNLRRGIQLILSVPLAMLGSLKAISRIITYTVVMFLEILGSIIAYALITELMYSVLTTFNSMLSMKTVGGVLFSQALGAAGFSVMGIITVIFNIWFMIMTIKLRKNIVRGLDQQAEAIISKFITGSAMHTGALNSRELTPVRQLGERPERTMGQKVGAATVKVASAAVNGAVAAAMLSSGNIPGAVSQMVSGAKNLQGAKQEASGETDADNPEGLNEVQADDDKPAYQGRIESKLKGLPGPTGENGDGPKDGGGDTGKGRNPDVPSDPNISNNGGVSGMVNSGHNGKAASSPANRASGTKTSALAPSGGGNNAFSGPEIVEARISGGTGGPGTRASQVQVNLLGNQNGSGGEGPAQQVQVNFAGNQGQSGGGQTQQAQFNLFGSQNVNSGGGNAGPANVNATVNAASETAGQAQAPNVTVNKQGQPGSGQPVSAQPVIIDVSEDSFRETSSEESRRPKFGRRK